MQLMAPTSTSMHLMVKLIDRAGLCAGGANIISVLSSEASDHADSARDRFAVAG
jgi:hypothetical protein